MAVPFRPPARVPGTERGRAREREQEKYERDSSLWAMIERQKKDEGRGGNPGALKKTGRRARRHAARRGEAAEPPNPLDSISVLD
jgi:hypothetical protein